MVPNAFTMLCWTKDLYGPQKKLGDVKGRIAFVSHEFWNVKIQNKIYSTLFTFSRSSCRWKEPVKIEWQGIKLFISIITSKCSKLHPPRHPSIFLRFFNFKSVVEDDCYNQLLLYGFNCLFYILYFIFLMMLIIHCTFSFSFSIYSKFFIRCHFSSLYIF
jgi:hypothetical protein